MRTLEMDPLRFVFGVHFHQPVGNFDHVFEQHVRDVYRPLLERLAEREFFPIALHISGPLLEWLEAHETALLDRIGGLAGDGRLELLLSGLYEPVLASLPRGDRVEEIRWMREAVEGGVGGGGGRRGGGGGGGGGGGRLARHEGMGVRARLAGPVSRRDGRAGRERRDPSHDAGDGPVRRAERWARLPADGVVPRDGRLGAAARRRIQAGATRARPRRGAARRSRRRVGTGGALAEFPRALSRSEPNAQEDAGAVGVVPALGRSGGGAPGDRPRAV